MAPQDLHLPSTVIFTIILQRIDLWIQEDREAQPTYW